MSDKATPTLKEATLDLSSQIAKAMEIDSKTGQATLDNKVFIANLPEGVTTDTVKAYSEYTNSFVAAAVDAYGRKATEILTKQKTVDRANFTANLIGRDSLTLDYKRQRVSVNPQDRENPIVSHGHIDVNLNWAAGNSKTGEIGRARQLIKSLASDAFAA